MTGKNPYSKNVDVVQSKVSLINKIYPTNNKTFYSQNNQK